MANYLALIAISKNDLISFLFQQLIKTHSLKNSPLNATSWFSRTTWDDVIVIDDVIDDVIAAKNSPVFGPPCILTTTSFVLFRHSTPYFSLSVITTVQG